MNSECLYKFINYIHFIELVAAENNPFKWWPDYSGSLEIDII